MKLLGGTFRLHPTDQPDFSIEVLDDEERGAEIGTGDGQGNVTEWFIKDVQGEWFKFGSVLHPQLVINGTVKGAEINDPNYGYDPKKMVLWDDQHETDAHYWRVIQKGKDAVRFENKMYRGMVMNCLGETPGNRYICLWE